MLPLTTTVEGNTASYPPYGECPHLLCSPLTSIGADLLRSNTAKSASYPGAILPLGTSNSLPGLSEAMRTASAMGSSPLRTMSMTIGIAVSTPGMPEGASSNGRAFSSAVWGAWSVPIMSNPPERNLLRRASRTDASLIGGLTLYSAPGKRSTSKVMWCMVTSVEKPAAFARSSPSGVVRWQMLMSLPLKCDARRDIAVHSAWAGRSRRWSLQHLSSTPFAMRRSSSAWTLMRLPVARAASTAGIISSSSSSRMLPVVEPMNSLKPTARGASMPALMPAVTAANKP